MNANVDFNTIHRLEERELDRVSGGLPFGLTTGSVDTDRTLAATAAVMFGSGAIGLGAVALTALFLRNPNY